MEDEENAEHIERQPDSCLCQVSFTFLSDQTNIIYVVKTLKVYFVKYRQNFMVHQKNIGGNISLPNAVIILSAVS